MKFVCIMQADGACDYSIGCGIKVLFIEADSKEEAINFMNNEWYMNDYERGDCDPSYYLNGGETPLKLWVIIEFEKAWDMLPMLHEWHDKFRATEEAKRKTKQEREDRAKYKELKQRFG